MGPQYPNYEITQYGINNELRMVVHEANGCDSQYFGHTCILDQLIEYGFVKAK